MAKTLLERILTVSFNVYDEFFFSNKNTGARESAKLLVVVTSPGTQMGVPSLGPSTSCSSETGHVEETSYP